MPGTMTADGGSRTRTQTSERRERATGGLAPRSGSTICTPEEDHIGRNVVYILKVLEFCPKISAACSDYNFLLCSAE